MSEISDLFTELLFGSGWWFGLSLLVAAALLVSSQVKYSATVFIMVFLFLAWEYFGNITADSLNAWAMIICLLVSLFLGGILYRDVSKKD